MPRRQRVPSGPAAGPWSPARGDAGDDDGLDAYLALRALRRRRRRRPGGRRLLLAAALAVAAIVAAVVGSLATGAAVLVSNCSLSSLRPIALGENSFVFASNGTRLGVVPAELNR